MEICPAVIRNFQEVLNKDWKFIFLCGSGMTSYYTPLLNDLPLPVELHELNVTNLSYEKYNELLTSRELWEIMDSEFVLIFQADTWLNKHCSRTIEEYFIYSYVGGNRDYHWKELTYLNKPCNPLGPFNGGLSLRRRLDMIRIIDHFQMLGVKFAEDVMFTIGCYMLGLPIGDSGLADTFCIHSILIQDPFGFHIQSGNEKLLQKAIQSFPDLQQSFYPTMYKKFINRIYYSINFKNAIYLPSQDKVASVQRLFPIAEPENNYFRVYATCDEHLNHVQFLVSLHKGKETEMNRLSVLNGIIESINKSADLLRQSLIDINTQVEDVDKYFLLLKDSAYFTRIIIGIHYSRILHLLHIVTAELLEHSSEEDRLQLQIFLDAEKDVARHIDEKEDVTVYTMAVILVYWIRTMDNRKASPFLFRQYMTLIVKQLMVSSDDNKNLTDCMHRISPEYCNILLDLVVCGQQGKISSYDEKIYETMVYEMNSTLIYVDIRFTYTLLDTWCHTNGGIHSLTTLSGMRG